MITLRAILAKDCDPGNRVGFMTAPSLRHQMHAVWADWRGRFEGGARICWLVPSPDCVRT